MSTTPTDDDQAPEVPQLEEIAPPPEEPIEQHDDPEEGDQ